MGKKGGGQTYCLIIFICKAGKQAIVKQKAWQATF